MFRKIQNRMKTNPSRSTQKGGIPMSEKEKQATSGIMEAVNILLETRGPEYVEGLVAGINIGTAKTAEAVKQPG